MGLVINRFLCALDKPYIYTETKYEFTCEGEVFKLTVKTPEQLGWKRIIGQCSSKLSAVFGGNKLLFLALNIPRSYQFLDNRRPCCKSRGSREAVSRTKTFSNLKLTYFPVSSIENTALYFLPLEETQFFSMTLPVESNSEISTENIQYLLTRN